MAIKSDDVFFVGKHQTQFCQFVNAKSDFRVIRFFVKLDKDNSASKLFVGLCAMTLNYKLQDLYIKVSINNFQSFMMSLV